MSRGIQGWPRINCIRFMFFWSQTLLIQEKIEKGQHRNKRHKTTSQRDWS